MTTPSRRTILAGVAALAVVAGATPAMAPAHAAGDVAYFVSPDGAGDCRSISSPCSLETARDLVRTVNDDMTGTITVNLLGGTYRLRDTFELTAADSGSNGYQVVWRAYRNEAVVISGARTLTGWELTDPARGVYSAPAPGLHTRQLYVNGVRAVRARSSGVLRGTVTLTTTGYTTTDIDLQSWPNPQDLEFVYTGGTPANQVKNWTEFRCGVADVSGTATSTTITMDQPCYANARARSARAPHYFENNYILLNQRGEWYLDRSRERIHYIPRVGEDMSTVQAVAGELPTLMTITGTLDAPVHDITVSGLRFSHTTWLGPEASDGFVERQASVYLTGTSRLWNKVPSSVVVTAGHRITFSGNTFTQLGTAGLDLGHGARDNRVIGNEFTDISASGVTIGDPNDIGPCPRPGLPEPGCPPDATPSESLADPRAVNAGNQVVNNWFHHLPREYHGGVAVLQFFARDSLISHNQINDVSYSAISTGYDHRPRTPSVIQDNRITNNLVYDHLQVLTDGGGIYNLGQQGPSLADGLFIEGNVVRQQSERLAAVYTDQGSQYITIRNNVLLNNIYDWGGCKPVGDMVFTGNFWQRANPAWPCAAAPPNLTISGNTVVDAAALPEAAQAIVDAAGLQPRYEATLLRGR